MADKKKIKPLATGDRTIPPEDANSEYQVPETLTVMKAVEYAGYTFVRGCGCRGGICGACATFYRFIGDYKLRAGLACQTVVEPNMLIAQLPFFPANRPGYDLENMDGGPHQALRSLYPEVFKCVGCGTASTVSCADSAPQGAPHRYPSLQRRCL
jgi:hypothetical protein